jgi:hypothetical protein
MSTTTSNIFAAAFREIRGTRMSYEEEDTCMAYEEEDACMSFEEEDTCMRSAIAREHIYVRKTCLGNTYI